jgi:hypothetical protein
MMLTVGSQRITGILPEDLDPETGQSWSRPASMTYKLGLSALAALPRLFTVLVIFVLTRSVTRTVNHLFLKIELLRHPEGMRDRQ